MSAGQIINLGHRLLGPAQTLDGTNGRTLNARKPNDALLVADAAATAAAANSSAYSNAFDNVLRGGNDALRPLPLLH